MSNNPEIGEPMVGIEEHPAAAAGEQAQAEDDAQAVAGWPMKLTLRPKEPPKPPKLLKTMAKQRVALGLRGGTRFRPKEQQEEKEEPKKGRYREKMRRARQRYRHNKAQRKQEEEQEGEEDQEEEEEEEGEEEEEEDTEHSHGVEWAGETPTVTFDVRGGKTTYRVGGEWGAGTHLRN
ncbi:uncharacterized protein BDZ99DRAFT_525861 [Mytilinidion resinicola]|uniref:Uncharacterized protein n=1 Tax=Mytilinidion resinicola TaxID=574789 RepID=A0A6A6Y8W4_9PEZI|nr:uncharacterized protein BDZ99DRAFT_525861 [Mytilinidion resinicola]KAF2804267.1 hypothetical protein BDZ99DRAFT_525861 [Mytilinidion resinicola]